VLDVCICVALISLRRYNQPRNTNMLANLRSGHDGELHRNIQLWNLCVVRTRSTYLFRGLCFAVRIRAISHRNVRAPLRARPEYSRCMFLAERKRKRKKERDRERERERERESVVTLNIDETSLVTATYRPDRPEFEQLLHPLMHFS